MRRRAPSSPSSTTISKKRITRGLALVDAIGTQFERWVATLQRSVVSWYAGSPNLLVGVRLYAIAFVGGLAASISLCILGMLPVNLAFVGASRTRGRMGAMLVASQFVAGVIVVTASVGLFASLFFALFVTYRGEINLVFGALMIVMGMWLAGIIRIPMTSLIAKAPVAVGPFAVGIAFALIASPRASPILIAVLGMVAYAIGYTAILWLASVFAGVAVASRRLLAHGETIVRLSAIALVVLGIGTVVYGFCQL